MVGWITDSMDVNFGKLREMVRDREGWGAAVHGVTESEMTEQLNNNNKEMNESAQEHLGMGTRTAPNIAILLTLVAISFIFITSSKFLNPITLLAVLKFSIGGKNDEEPAANNNLSYRISSLLSRYNFFSLISILVTSTSLIQFILYILKKLSGVKSKSSISLLPSKK